MMIRLTFAEILYLFSAFHGVFLSTLLVIRKRSVTTNIYLALLILLFSFYLVENVIFSSGYLRQFPHFFLATLPLTFLIGPLFYTYIRSNVYSPFRLAFRDLLHLVPFFIEIAILWRFYVLDASIKLKIYDYMVHSQEPGRFNIYFVGFLIYTVSTCWYFYSSFRMLSHVDTVNDPGSKPKRRWLRWSSIVFFSYMILGLIMSVISNVRPEVRPSFFHLNLILQTLLIHAIGYVAFLYPDLFRYVDIRPAKKYQFSSLNEPVMSDLKVRLIKLIEEHRPYLDSEITPEYFLGKLGISKQHFSQLLTEGMKTSFYDLINSYRIETAKTLLVSRSHENAKVLHIAYDCGFSNKSSFLRNFKRLTGSTPTEYRISQIKQVPLD